jgi:hypothetical protein
MAIGMTTASQAPIEGRLFRAGSEFELVVFDRLPHEEQAALAELRSDANFYGVLKPRSANGRTIKSVNKDTALLFLTLQQPGPLPFFVYDSEPDETRAAVWRLVLDGILEAEDGGRFVSGSEAAERLANRTAAAPSGRLAVLSRSALRLAERSGLHDASLLAAWLYRFGSEPISPRWTKRLPDGPRVLDFVDAAPGSARGRTLDAHWDAADAPSAEGWIAWSRRGRAHVAPGEATCKLYVSPRIEAVPEAFGHVLEIATARGMGFKIGGNAAGLLRPDKIVVYFSDQERLLEAASDLAGRLASCPAQGVPFSAEITPDGMLSWGMDPPQRERRLMWEAVESWRLWVVRRLAVAMIAADGDRASSTLSPAQFALERLRHEGVDVDHWMPAARLWRAD